MTKNKKAWPTNGYTYMKYTCMLDGMRTTSVFAKLETEDQSATAVDGSCCSNCDTLYGMNYYQNFY